MRTICVPLIAACVPIWQGSRPIAARRAVAATPRWRVPRRRTVNQWLTVGS
jgi:hypothetical protein